MQDYFYKLSDRLMETLIPNEVMYCKYEGETSDFVRFNHNKIRQAGNVIQQSLTINLIFNNRQASAQYELSGQIESDIVQLNNIINLLREQIGQLQEDPFINFSDKTINTETIHENDLPDPGDMVDQITSYANGLDMVGILANGTIYSGFSNSLGQRNWHSSKTFNFDWSSYHDKDKAVKKSYAGFHWDKTVLQTIFDDLSIQLDTIKRKSVKIEPGLYRVYLAPAALNEILGMMSWGGFGLKSHRTSQTPLLKMITEDKLLSASVNLSEENNRGLSPCFTNEGFILSENTNLISAGKYHDTLANARSAKEYQQSVNSLAESPVSLDMSAGKIQTNDLLNQIDTGIYINNLWYCNFSDRNNCKITGMTRFACYWVENGEIQAPVNVMRFDDSVFNILGSNLSGLTREKHMLFDPGTYDQRSTSSSNLPGAVVDDFALTL